MLAPCRPGEICYVDAANVQLQIYIFLTDIPATFYFLCENDDWSIFGRGNERARWMCCSWYAYIFFTVGHWSIFQRGMSAQRQHHALRAHSLFGTCGIRLLHQIGPNISNAMAQIVGISVGGSTLKSTKDRFSYGVWKWGEHPAP